MRNLVIAIDGPAASGKSTTARLTARRLGYLHVNTGAMYRAITLKALEQNTDLENEEAVGCLAETSTIRFEGERGSLKVILDNRDVTKGIRSRDVTRAVSIVSNYKKVREVMVREQRRLAGNGGVVLEGRDIGTVVFPQADLKVYMVATIEKRARRRQFELEQEGIVMPFEAVKKDILHRDEIDSNRDLNPLRKAEDAIILDTSAMTIEQQVEFIVRKANEITARRMQG